MKIQVSVANTSPHQSKLQDLRQRQVLLAMKNASVTAPVVVYNTPNSFPASYFTNPPADDYPKIQDTNYSAESVSFGSQATSKNFSQETMLHGENIYKVEDKIAVKNRIQNFLKLFETKNLKNILKSGLKAFKLNTKLARNIGVVSLLGATSVLSAFYLFNGDFIKSKSAVAGKIEYAGSSVENFEGYKKWILEKNNKEYSAPFADLDEDQLTNYEEFDLKTSPISKFSCDPKITDMENLLQLINPATCKPIDFNNQEESKQINKVISLPEIQSKLAAEIEKEAEKQKNSSTQIESSSLLSLFQVNSFEDISKINPNDLQSLNTKVLTENNLKQEYLNTIKKINSYIENNRSYEIYDRDYETPVDGAVYLEVALKYNTPLKYVLTIARTESRFGTDRFTNSGNPTRPGQYKNIYSMGLTDSGSNLGFNTWEEGVESFGKWYKKFQDRGVSDCAKWRIYNPNGDYCTKVENLAKEIDLYLKS